MSSRSDRRKPWSGPVDMNQINTESITILQYWDITTPPPKGAKLSKFRSSRRHRRISLEMHRLPRDLSLDLADVFNNHDDNESNSSKYLTYNKAFFRISKFVPVKNISGGMDNSPASGGGGGGDDSSTVVSDVSARTKDFFSKPDHEWRTKFLLKVSRVAITEIKNEKEVFFEAWDNGEVIERSLVFKTIGQAKEFSYDLERLANEDPDINEEGGGSFVMPHDMIIKTPTPSLKEDAKEDQLQTQQDQQEDGNTGSGAQVSASLESSQLQEQAVRQSVTSSSQQQSTRQSFMSRSRTQVDNGDVEVGHRSLIVQPSSSNTNNSKGCCHSFTFILTDMIHFLGMIISLSVFFYTIAIFSYKPDPLIVFGLILLSWSFFIALTHGSGILGIHKICCGGTCCINCSILFGIVSVLLHGALVVIIDVRKEDFFHYLTAYCEKLFLTEDIVEDVYLNLLYVFIAMICWSVLEALRICFLLRLKPKLFYTSYELSSSVLTTPLLATSQVRRR